MSNMHISLWHVISWLHIKYAHTVCEVSCIHTICGYIRVYTHAHISDFSFIFLSSSINWNFQSTKCSYSRSRGHTESWSCDRDGSQPRSQSRSCGRDRSRSCGHVTIMQSWQVTVMWSCHVLAVVGGVHGMLSQPQPTPLRATQRVGLGLRPKKKRFSLVGVTGGTRRGKGVNFSVTRVLINNPWPWPWPWPCDFT
jgi:hypothetical protein